MYRPPACNRMPVGTGADQLRAHVGANNVGCAITLGEGELHYVTLAVASV